MIAFPKHCLVAWVGDSRVYRLRGQEFAQMTQDHSEVEELIASGTITREQAKDHALSNVITRAVGGVRQLFLDLDLFELEPGDRFLICSDGLYKEMADDELLQQLKDGDVETACKALIDEALRHECRDNVTAVVVEFQ
jgi:serine/threonine protein phosphatase PrpC